MKINVGVFEFFSYFISGVPIVLACLLLYQFPNYDIDKIIKYLAKHSSASIVTIFIITAYIVGNLLSGISLQIFKFFHNRFSFLIKRKLGKTANNLLKELDWTIYEISENLLSEFTSSLDSDKADALSSLTNTRFNSDNELVEVLSNLKTANPFTSEELALISSTAKRKTKIPESLDSKEFLNLSFEKRLAYLTNLQIGKTYISWVEHRILPLIRSKCPENANVAENYMALHIMFRNLWIGLSILTIVSISGAFFHSSELLIYMIVAILLFFASLISFKRALLFHSWWSREIIFAFYHLALDKYYHKSACE